MKISFPGLAAALLFILPVLFSACKKEQMLTSGGELVFSTDTLSFDTVFTAQGSFTLGIRIYNRQGQKINISSVRLEKGDRSFFHLNVDGIQGNQVTNREVAANDSIHVFATVNIDPTDQNTPFVVEDRLIATLNGKDYSIPMIAYGQNAYYVRDSVLSSAVWKTDKPYVIINSAAIDANQVLIIPPGCRIYMHADSRLFVLGKLIARGTKADSIIFQGDRLDRSYFGYEGYPGEWGGIYFFEESSGSELDWVVLRNGGNGARGALPATIQVTGNDASAGIRQLTMKHTVIENSIGYGIVAFQGNFMMENCLVQATGAPALGIFQGGNYTVRNCDFINYSPKHVNHTDQPTVAVLNYLDTGNRPQDYIFAPLEASFTNCLVYGSLEEEFVARGKGSNVVYNLVLDHCLLKTSRKEDVLPSFVTQINCKYNEDPGFADRANSDFRAMNSSSPLVDAGTGSTTSPTDLDDRPRLSGTIDIGCYEFQ